MPNPNEPHKKGGLGKGVVVALLVAVVVGRVLTRTSQTSGKAANRQSTVVTTTPTSQTTTGQGNNSATATPYPEWKPGSGGPEFSDGKIPLRPGLTVVTVIA